MSSIQILGIRVDDIDVEGLHSYIQNIVLGHCKALILNVNIHAVNLAFKNPSFRTILNQSDLTFCDGAGIRLAAWFLGKKLKPRITYADWMWQLAEFAAQKGLSMYLVGGALGIAAQAGVALQKKHPGLIIAGVHHGYFNKSESSEESKFVVAAINAAKPDILITGFGMPAQEFWLSSHWQSLDVRIGLSGGAVFDYISGNVKRGPPILIRTGFEWLARLLIEPKRLWKRYIIGNPLFLWRLMRYGKNIPASIRFKQSGTF